MRTSALLLAAALGVSAYAPLSGSRISASRVARSATVEMVKKSVGDLAGEELKGKKVLVRCDLNVPLDGKTSARATPPVRPNVGLMHALANRNHT